MRPRGEGAEEGEGSAAAGSALGWEGEDADDHRATAGCTRESAAERDLAIDAH